MLRARAACRGMPDDVVRSLLPGSHTAVVALTHDPKLDDLALLEALQPDAAFFYVGALGNGHAHFCLGALFATYTGAVKAQIRMNDFTHCEVTAAP